MTSSIQKLLEKADPASKASIVANQRKNQAFVTSGATGCSFCDKANKPKCTCGGKGGGSEDYDINKEKQAVATFVAKQPSALPKLVFFEGKKIPFDLLHYAEQHEITQPEKLLELFKAYVAKWANQDGVEPEDLLNPFNSDEPHNPPYRLTFHNNTLILQIPDPVRRLEFFDAAKTVNVFQEQHPSGRHFAIEEPTPDVTKSKLLDPFQTPTFTCDE